MTGRVWPERRLAPAADYVFIRRWGALIGSLQYYISDELTRARADGAPQNAVYWHWDDDDKQTKRIWVTTDDINSVGTRARLGLKEGNVSSE